MGNFLETCQTSRRGHKAEAHSQRNITDHPSRPSDLVKKCEKGSKLAEALVYRPKERMCGHLFAENDAGSMCEQRP